MLGEKQVDVSLSQLSRRLFRNKQFNINSVIINDNHASGPPELTAESLIAQLWFHACLSLNQVCPVTVWNECYKNALH